MFIDSHCHLDRIDLAPYGQNFAEFMRCSEEDGIRHMLCIGIDLESYPAMYHLVAPYPQISLSVGVHPDAVIKREPLLEALLDFAVDDKVIAIGETGLDYFRGKDDIPNQKQRFVTHIHAAGIVNKPLIIHTREAGHDSLDILRQEGADGVGGIIHCFTEDWNYAAKALDLNFYISFSGIVTFKNARAIQEVAKKIPADRFLIETDSPYLAPVPFRGKPNYPANVRYVAQFIAELRGLSLEKVAELSAENFCRLFADAHVAA